MSKKNDIDEKISIPWWYTPLVMLFPFLLISLIAWLTKFGTDLFNKDWMIINLSNPIEIGDYMYYYITVLSIEIAATLSWLLYKSALNSNRIARDMSEKEDNRDREKYRESAIIVYYDLVTNINILRSEYKRFVLNKNNASLNKNLINSDWVKNTANLRVILSEAELSKLFNLYNAFALISEMSESTNSNNSEYVELIKKVSEEIFIPALKPYFTFDLEGSTISVLKYDYYEIMYKIELLSKGMEHEENNDSFKMVRQVKQIEITSDNDLPTIVDEYFIDMDNLLYRLEYSNGILKNGSLISVEGLVFSGELDSDYSIINGYGTQFYSNRSLKYQGNIKEGQYHGNGKEYKRDCVEPYFIGVYEDGKKKEGCITGSKNSEILFFEGEFMKGIPYNGVLKMSKLGEFSGTYNFNGEIQNGKPFAGTGKRLNKNIYSEEYQQTIDEHDFYDNRDPYEEIPDDVMQEWKEDSYRNEVISEKESLIENYHHVVELIGASWESGQCIEYEDDYINKSYFAKGDSKK